MLFQPLIYAFIFIGVFMMVEGVYLVIYGKTLKREKKINRRLALLQDGKDTEEVMGILRQEREGAEKHERMPVIGPLVEMARHAAITISIPQIAISMVVLAVVSFLLLTMFTGAVIQIRIVVALITGYAAFYIWLRGKAKKRISLFEEQLPDALDLMVRSLRVGHPMNSAVGIGRPRDDGPSGHRVRSDCRRGDLWHADHRCARPHGCARSGARPSVPCNCHQHPVDLGR